MSAHEIAREIAWLEQLDSRRPLPQRPQVAREVEAITYPSDTTKTQNERRKRFLAELDAYLLDHPGAFA